MKTETIAIHAGNHTDAATNAVVQPLVMSTTLSVAKMAVILKDTFTAVHQTLIGRL